MVIFSPMKNPLRNSIALAILPQIALVIWLRQQPELVESWYSQGLYVYLSGFLRLLYGWVPFSVGDCLYAVSGFLALRYLYIHRNRVLHQPLGFLRDVAMVLSVAYFSFHLLWGFNYYRQPLSSALGLGQGYSQSELTSLTRQLIERTNRLQLRLTSDPDKMVALPYKKKEILQKTLEGYRELRATHPFLEYRRPSIKTSLFSTPLTFMGYGGYLNPFTNEAQVNGRVPLFRFPVICGHEIGHQLGYSAENETNFIGYLATAGNKDPYFQYAAAAYAAGYCLAEINRKEPETYHRLYGRFNKGVQQNFKELDDFWKAYENPLEPAFKEVFNTFLKANNQAEGIRSYSRIVALLVTYHRKHPL